ncbi:hypothetical protein RYA99_07770, partial [Pseudomonas syringae pv. actinidifoliorum]|nr:hypothetical protein [Pseudomonas syringae pv. actinidifoliorum]
GTARQRCLGKPNPHFLLGGVCGADTMYLRIALKKRGKMFLVSLNISTNQEPMRMRRSLQQINSRSLGYAWLLLRQI